MIQLVMVAIMATLYYHCVSRKLDSAIVMLASCTVILNTVTQAYVSGAHGIVVAFAISFVVVGLGHLPVKQEVIRV